MNHVIIGGGIAGLTAASEIRKADKGASITLITDEPGAPYYRPLIPMLIENAAADISFAANPYDVYAIRRIDGRVTAIDTSSKTVSLASGESLAYDRLLIATGGSAAIPSVAGTRRDGVFALKTRYDAIGIRRYAPGRKTALIIGGGLVGVKAAISLSKIGVQPTIVERMGRILPQRLDDGAAQIAAGLLERAGIGVITGDEVGELRENTALLASGGEIGADIVITALGSRPNLDALSGANIAVSSGIVVDEMLQSQNSSGVFAAGDVCEHTDIATGRSAVCASWTNTEETGRIAGRNMAGAGIKYAGFLSVMNATEILRTPVITIGMIDTQEPGFDSIISRKDGGYRKLVLRDDGTLAGAVFMGDNTARAGIYTWLIRNRIPLGRRKDKAIAGTLGFADLTAA
ncbi:MAG: NAD(P)/FAD-dependent oxidoreductase [Nitrospirae bacterium]|nr:NAD(P)/FAD-dependent oxidoreductase [Nitrospirota bacterium]